jgi:uncharacterized protein DUF3987
VNPIDNLLSRLKAAGCDPKETGTGQWRSKCPSHQGRSSNLSIKEGDDGSVLLNCHHQDGGGQSCNAEAITKALGLSLRDLFPPRGAAPSNAKPRSKPQSGGNGKPYPTAEKAIGAAANAAGGKVSTHGPWIYKAADGKGEEMRIYRIDMPDGDKQFRPVYRDSAGWHLGDPRKSSLPPYHLDELAAAPLLVVAEGEKCADLVRDLGIPATTSSHGSNSPHKTDWSPLAGTTAMADGAVQMGKTVVIIPDNDDPGRGYKEAVATILSGLNPPPIVKVLELPLKDEGDDIEQWLQGLPASWGPDEKKAELLKLIGRAEEWKPAAAAATADVIDSTDDVEIVDRWPRLDPKAFHGLAGELVELADPHSEADPVAILIQLLVAFGNMIGRSAHFSVGATRHFLNLFAAMIGPTALGRKGTSLDIILWFLRLADPDWSRDRVQGGLVSGEGLIHHVRDETWNDVEVKDPQTKQKRRERVLTDAGVADKRLLIVETEMSRMLKAMNRDTNTLSDVIRQAWDTGQLRTLGKHNPAKASDAHVSIICHATQADVRKHLTETDSANGFANRFLWVCSRRSKILPDGGNLESVNWTPIQQKLMEAAAFAKQPDRSSGVSQPGRRVTRDQKATKVWHAIYEELSAGRPGLVGKILSRAEAQVMRLACLYALLDSSEQVKAEHLGAAVAIWEYCEASARLVFGDGMGDPDAEKVLKALKEQPAGLTRSQVNIDVFRRNRKAEELTALLSDLLTQGLIHRKTDQSTGGRAAERWYFGRGS